MSIYRGTFSIDTNFFRKLNGVYNIDKYTLIPCLITPKEQNSGCSKFILQFDFEGIEENILDNSKQTMAFFNNSNKGNRMAETFIAWFVTCTRSWARVSHSRTGSSMKYGPTSHQLLKNYDDKRLDKIFHVDRTSKIGNFFKIKRPNYDIPPKKNPLTLELPEDIIALTKKLFSLREKEKNTFLDACFAYQFALDNWGAYPTISIIALVSAIESLVADKYTSGVCNETGKKCSLKRDVMKKFREFFENNLQYPLPPELIEFLNSVYSSRSKYVHKYLLGDVKTRGIFSIHSYLDSIKVKNEQEKLEQIVNASLIEWLKRIKI